MPALFRFISRNPWIFIVLAFLLLIGAWVTAYVVACRVPLHELPVQKPARHAPAQTH